MHLVLHIGLPKTGSTSIQENLKVHHEALKELGIVFPLSHGNFLHPFHLRRVFLSKNIDQIRQNKERNPRLYSTFREMERVFDTEPSVVFLSSEDIAEEYDNFSILRQNIGKFSDRFTILAYFRDPVSYYRSIVQHHVKSQGFIPSPREWDNKYVKIINQGRSHFGSQFLPISTNKRTLRNGSIVDDALWQCEGLIPIDATFDTSRNNSSSSSEVSAVLQEFMLQHQKGVKQYGSRNTKLRLTLEAYSRKNGLETKAVLKEQVEETLLSLSRNDLLYLRDHHDIFFDSIDYDSLKHSQIHQSVLDFSKVSDILKVDQEIFFELKNVANEFLKSEKIQIY